MSTGTSAKRQVLNPEGTELAPDIPASAAVLVEPFVFVGSTTASDYATGLSADALPDPGLPLSGKNPKRLETEKIYARIGACLEAGGSSFDRTIQVNQWVACFHGEDAARQARKELLLLNGPADEGAGVSQDDIDSLFD